jgi:hypothetical protein
MFLPESLLLTKFNLASTASEPELGENPVCGR